MKLIMESREEKGVFLLSVTNCNKIYKLTMYVLSSK